MIEIDFYTNESEMLQSFNLPLLQPESITSHFPQGIYINIEENINSLYFAVTSNDEGIKKFLLKAGVPINSDILDYPVSLNIAIESGDSESVKVLLDYNTMMDLKYVFGKTPLHFVACMNSKDENEMLRIVKIILDEEINVKNLLNEHSYSGETPLHYAILNGSIELIKLFLQHGADINVRNRDGKSPLWLAIELNNVKVIELLLKNKARVNDKMNYGMTVLHEAVGQKADSIVKLLLTYGAKVNVKNIYGHTPLHIAAPLNRLDDERMDRILKCLLNKGANVNDSTNEGVTAFNIAIINGNEKLIKLFLKYGANVNLKDYEGKTPLHFAIQYSNENVVKMLLDRGANIDEQTNEGTVALHIVITLEDENMTKILLDYNANVNCVDKSGKTPLSVAMEVAHMRSIYNPWNGYGALQSKSECAGDVFELLIKHIATLAYVCEENLNIIEKDNRFSAYYKECKLELGKMKEKVVCDNVSFYKVLTKNIDLLVNYTRNENLIRIFESNFYADKYPIYYYTLKNRFYKAEDKRKLLEPALVTLSKCVKPFSFPNLIIEQILSYLTIQDIINLSLT